MICKFASLKTTIKLLHDCITRLHVLLSEPYAAHFHSPDCSHQCIWSSWCCSYNLDCFKSLRNLSVLFLQANRARTALIQQIDAFFAGNGLDAFIGPSTNETSMGNVVGLPQMVIPVDFEPVSVGSARQQPTTVGIYALPNHDSKVQPCLFVSLCLSTRNVICLG